MAIVVAMTMAATHLLTQLGWQLGAAFKVGRYDAAPTPADAAMADHVIIAGYRRVGRAAGVLLDNQRSSHIAVDARALRMRHLRSQGATGALAARAGRDQRRTERARAQ